jgi:phosphate transport system permease protein
MELIGAVVVAIGAAVVAHSAFGISGPLAMTAVAYLGFVATVALSEFIRNSREARAPDEIDLTVEEALDAGSPAQATPPQVVLRAVSDDDIPDVPIKRRKVTGADIAEMGVAALGAAAVAELARIVLHMQSLVGVAIWWYVAFVAIFFLLARDRADVETALDRLVTLLVVTTGLLVCGVLFWMLGFILVKGIHLLSWTFFTQDMRETGPLDPGGGAKHAIIGTLEQVGLAAIVVVPIGILTAVYLHEVRGRLATVVRFIVDAMSGLPSIVAGLLVFTVWVGGHGYSGLAGAIALAVLMLPTMTRASEEILRTVPDSLREGALALGAPQWRLVQRVVLPTAIAGLLTAVLLSVARAIGETAPMLLTAFGVDSTNTNPTKGAQSDLPLFVWKYIRQPNSTQQARAFTGALILVLLVFILFVSARIITSRATRKLGRTR